MCGILAYYNVRGQPVDRTADEIAGLRDMMRNRGPDADGYLAAADRSWILAHRRLSILDLSENGLQPMSDPDRKIHVCYNGEIYNFRELRAELVARGARFVSTSDTEVILHLYREEGIRCLPRLRGMFALIIVDEHRKCMVIARDPLGKKPLYYAEIAGNVVVASDPGVISRDREYRKRVSVDGLYSLLTMNGVKSPDSLFEGIRKLEPGRYRIVDRDFRLDAPSQRYFSFPLVKQSELRNGPDSEAQLDSLLDQAVARRMISDVPFGVYLSGGIDSALIVSYMSQYTDRVNTFSIDLAMSQDAKRETDVAKSVARQFRTNHHDVQLTDQEYIDLLDGVVLRSSTPSIPDSVLLVKLSRLARANGVVVIETGEGADELFFGYAGYLPSLYQGYQDLARLRGLVPSFARVACALGPATRVNRLSYALDSIDMRSRKLLFTDFLYQPFFSYQAERIARRRTREKPAFNKFAALTAEATAELDHYQEYAPSSLSFQWHRSFRWADLLLDRIDGATMSCGVEGRAPFLDVDVIAFALSLTDDLKHRDGVSKYILRKIAERRVSKEHAALPKRGFGGGNDNMLNDRVCSYMRGKLASSNSYRDAPLLKLEQLSSRSQLFVVTMFHAWADNWM